MNTYMAKASDVQRKWYIVDAEGVVLAERQLEDGWQLDLRWTARQEARWRGR